MNYRVQGAWGRRSNQTSLNKHGASFCPNSTKTASRKDLVYTARSTARSFPASKKTKSISLDFSDKVTFGVGSSCAEVQFLKSALLLSEADKLFTDLLTHCTYGSEVNSFVRRLNLDGKDMQKFLKPVPFDMDEYVFEDCYFYEYAKVQSDWLTLNGPTSNLKGISSKGRVLKSIAIMSFGSVRNLEFRVAESKETKVPVAPNEEKQSYIDVLSVAMDHASLIIFQPLTKNVLWQFRTPLSYHDRDEHIQVIFYTYK